MTLEEAQDYVNDALGELADTCFSPDSRLTFVQRVPGKPGRWMVVSDDHELQAHIKQHLEALDSRKENTTHA